MPAKIKDDVEFLRANIYMATGRPNDAVEVLKHLQSDPSLAGFVAYNLGIALLQAGKQQEAMEQLDKAGQLPANDPAGLAIRDKSNLVLGSMLFESGNFERAKQSLDRVRLDGPFSNQALLRAGWADTSSKQFDRALVPWNILADREPTDVAVQEAMLAVPHAYADLKLYGRAALTYGRALELYSNQIEKSRRIDQQHQGRAVSQGADPRGEPGGPNLGHPPAQPARCAGNVLPDGADGVSRLPDRVAQLPRPRGPAVEAHGLSRPALMLSTISSDCADRTTSRCCRRSTRKFRELDSRMRLRLEQRKQFDERLQAMLTAPRPDYLATTDERIASERIALIEKQLGDSDSPESLALRQRAARLRGVLTWRRGNRVPQAADRGI